MRHWINIHQATSGHWLLTIREYRPGLWTGGFRQTVTEHATRAKARASARYWLEQKELESQYELNEPADWPQQLFAQIKINIHRIFSV